MAFSHTWEKEQVELIGRTISTVVTHFSGVSQETFSAWCRGKALEASIAHAQMEVTRGEDVWSPSGILDQAELYLQWIKDGIR